MTNQIYRARVQADILYAVSAARAAGLVKHPGLIGRVRELAAEQLFRPMLPHSMGIGTGKITDGVGSLSGETDLVIYDLGLLPPIMFSGRDGVFPVESVHCAVEVKSLSSAAHVTDAIEKMRLVRDLQPGKKTTMRGPIRIFFAFASDLKASKSELDRYRELDPDADSTPALNCICVVGQGTWYHISGKWRDRRADDDHIEVLSFLSVLVNTLSSRAAAARQQAPQFGDYLKPSSGVSSL